MDTTFITIHDLSPEARILYCSDSIVDILGWKPEEVVRQSCWKYFHPAELPFAQATHARGVKLDKAAVLSYCRVRDNQGEWTGCEVVFTIVYDVLVGCTSIYRRGLKSQKRALEAPIVRRMFSCSPRDPRYYMLQHLSSRFQQPPPAQDEHEPRAALFLNRYTRTLTIMYATDGLSKTLGISGEELRGKSFYYCIEENCLQDAVRCLENAKVNDSIAYFRFWYRDPLKDERDETLRLAQRNPTDVEMEDARSSEDRQQNDQMYESSSSARSQAVSAGASMEPESLRAGNGELNSDYRTSSDESTHVHSHEAVFGEPQRRSSSVSSVSSASLQDAQATQNPGPIELEAVISCTADGLVVCLRRARPMLPQTYQEVGQSNGLFVSPWATRQALNPSRPITQAADYSPGASGPGPRTGDIAESFPIQTYADQGLRGHEQSAFMDSIRDCAIFAWAVTGINGTLALYGYGQPRGEAQPLAGLPIWRPKNQLTDPPATNGPDLIANMETNVHESLPGHKREENI